MADPNQTPARGDWICPCTGCAKARRKAFNEVLEILDGGGDAYSRLDALRKLVEIKPIKKQ